MGVIQNTENPEVEVIVEETENECEHECEHEK